MGSVIDHSENKSCLGEDVTAFASSGHSHESDTEPSFAATLLF